MLVLTPNKPPAGVYVWEACSVLCPPTFRPIFPANLPTEKPIKMPAPLVLDRIAEMVKEALEQARLANDGDHAGYAEQGLLDDWDQLLYPQGITGAAPHEGRPS